MIFDVNFINQINNEKRISLDKLLLIAVKLIELYLLNNQ